MTEQEVREIRPHLVEAVGEITQTMTKGLVAAQERNLQFVQTTFANAMELLESQVEATGALLQEVEQQAAWQHVAPRGMGSLWVKA